MRIRTLLKFVLLPMVVVIVAVVTLLSTMDFSRYRPLVAEKVKEATGRDFEIVGGLHLAIGLTPAIVVEDVRLQNATFGTRAEMIKARRLEADVALLPLLLGRLEIDRLALIGPDILLEIDERGRSNWDFSRDDESYVAKPATEEQAVLDLPRLQSVTIENGLLTYRNLMTGKTTKLEVVRFTGWSPSRNAPLEVDLTAAYDGVPFHVAGRLGAIVTLGSPGAYPIDLTADTADFQMAVKGTVNRPLSPTSSKLSIEASGNNLKGLTNLIKVPLPAGPLAFSATLATHDGAMTLSDIKAKLGNSDIAGQARWEQPKDRPIVSASLTAQQLDFADFKLSGVPSENGAKAKAEAKGEPIGAANAASNGAPNGAPSGAPNEAPDDGRLFSAEPLPLDVLKAVDGKLDAKIEKLVMGRTTLEQASFTAALQDGRLTVEPLTGVIAQGELAGAVTIESGSKIAKLNLKVSKLDVNSLAQASDIGDILAGKVDIAANVSGQGESLRALMAGLNGTASIVMGKGEVKSSYVELLGADLLRLAASAGSDSETTTMNCLVGRFDITKGLASSRDILFDTSNMTVKGEGNISLASEHLDLKFTPRPKDVSLINLAMPWRVGGSFSKPEVSLDEIGAATHAAGALLSVVNPLALLVPLVTSVGGDKNPCLAALEAPRQGQAPAKKEPAKKEPAKKEPASVRGLIDRVLPGQ